MTRNELIREIRQYPTLVETINETEGKNYTNCKTDVLVHYYNSFMAQAPAGAEEDDCEGCPYENAIVALLMYLDSKGLLGDLLDKLGY